MSTPVTLYDYLSLEELYERLHECEKTLVVETNILAKVQFKKLRQSLKGHINLKLDAASQRELLDILPYRIPQIKDLLDLLYDCLTELDQTLIDGSDVIEKHRNDRQRQGINTWIKEFEHEYSQTSTRIKNLSTLSQSDVENSSSLSECSLPEINYDLLKYKIQHYFARKALLACEKQESCYSYDDTTPPSYLHYFKDKQRDEILKLDLNFREAGRTNNGPNYTVSFVKLKYIFCYWLEKNQTTFIKRCTDIGIDSSIFEIRDAAVKAEKLIYCCQKSTVVLHHLVYYILQEGYDLRKFIVNNDLLSA
jgi:hypothetical protein